MSSAIEKYRSWSEKYDELPPDKMAMELLGSKSTSAPRCARQRLKKEGFDYAQTRREGGYTVIKRPTKQPQLSTPIMAIASMAIEESPLFCTEPPMYTNGNAPHDNVTIDDATSINNAIAQMAQFQADCAQSLQDILAIMKKLEKAL